MKHLFKMDAVNRKYQKQLRNKLMGDSIKQQLEREKEKQKQNKRDYRMLMIGFYVGVLFTLIINLIS